MVHFLRSPERLSSTSTSHRELMAVRANNSIKGCRRFRSTRTQLVDYFLPDVYSWLAMIPWTGMLMNELFIDCQFAPTEGFLNNQVYYGIDEKRNKN